MIVTENVTKIYTVGALVGLSKFHGYGLMSRLKPRSALAFRARKPLRSGISAKINLLLFEKLENPAMKTESLTSLISMGII
jgi:hypothetical protein